MPFISAHPNEYLVVSQDGRITNRGLGTSTFLWPGTPYVLLSSTQQEASFEMTQESRDGIPLRFKGLVIYRVVAPELTAQLFNFANANGHTAIQTLISHICLGELRAVVAQLSMQECVEQRKTTLTDAVALALQQVAQGSDEHPGWGIVLDVVQIAQVFIVDQELRRQLEAELRNKIKSQSDLSELHMREELQRAQLVSERRLQQEALETEKERLAIARATLLLQAEFEQEELSTRTPLRLTELTAQQEIAQAELALATMRKALRVVEVERDMLLAQAEHALRKDILPLEQLPQIAEATSRVWQGTNLSIYGESTPLLATLGPLLELLTRGMQGAIQADRSSEAI